jgi:hypothetical protein
MMQRKRWSDLTTGQQTAIQIGAGVQMALLAAALWDMWHRPAEEINGDRRLWTLASFVNFVGPLAYFAFGRKGCCLANSEKAALPTDL